MKSHARVVVIGGGVMGVSLVYHLTRLGWPDVVLLEKNELTAGSTWHAAGLCTHFAHHPTIMSLRAHSVRLYKSELTADTGLPVGFHPVGALRVTRKRERIDEFRHVQGVGRFVGCEFRIIEPGELQALHPLAQTEGLMGGIYEPDDGHVDPSQATQAMAAGARERGATIYRQTPVEAIEPTAGGHWRLHTPAGTIHAETIVNAAGTWCRDVGSLMGAELPVVPILHQYLVTDSIEAVAALDRELPIIRDPEESWYIRQERDGLIVGPYEKDAQTWAVDGVPSQFGMELLAPDLDRVEPIVEAAMRRVPALAEGGIKTVINGPITFTPDGNPLIGPAFGLPNAWLLTGSSMGVMEGGGAGRFLAEWIVEREPPMDALAVDPRRFGGYADRSYRIAKAVECFGLQFGVHYPHEERPAGRPRRTSALHRRWIEAGAVMGCAYGWERANYFARTELERQVRLSFRRSNWFGAVADECQRVSEDAGVCDISAIAKFELSGSQASGWLDGLGANRAPRGPGRIGLMHVLVPSGGVAAELAITCLDTNAYYVTSAAVAERLDIELLRARADGFDVEIDNVTEAWGALALMGPNAKALIEDLTSADLSIASFPWLSARMIELAGIPVRALRMSYVGESGFELHVPMARLGELYAAIERHGAAHGLARFGAFATNAMRLEKGYRAWGVDLGTERTPLEAGLTHLVRDAGREFVGRAGMLAREAQGAWRMGLVAIDACDADAFALHPIIHAAEVIGVTTSGAFGHRVGKSLALAYFKDGLPDPGDELRVLLLGDELPASLLPEVPYDPENRRMKYGEA
ncbi:MAG: GcvT family protein [Gammaproteobacteria bacterium]